MDIKPLDPSPICFKRTIRDPHWRRKKIIDICLISVGSFGLGFLTHKLINDKFEGRKC